MLLSLGLQGPYRQLSSVFLGSSACPPLSAATLTHSVDVNGGSPLLLASRAVMTSCGCAPLRATRLSGWPTSVSSRRGAAAGVGQRPARPNRPAAAVGDSGSSADVGAAFLQQFKSIASSPPPAPAADTSGCGCSGSKSKAQAEPASGCCGGGSGGVAEQAAAAVGSQLNSLMSGLQGSLSRQDIRDAFESAAPVSTL